MVETAFRIAIFAIVIAFVIGIFGTVAFNWTLDTSSYLQGLTSFLHVIFYVLPMGKLSPIIICFLSLMTFRIVISIIKTIWSIIPIGV